MPNAKVVKPLFNKPNRSPNGVGTAYREDIKGLFGQFDPGQWHVLFDDFDWLNATPQKYTQVLVGAGSVNAAGSQDGGINTMTNSAANNDVTSNGQTTPSFLPEVATVRRSLIGEAKFEVDDATLAHVGFGLIAGSSTLTPFTYTEGIAIRKPQGGTSFVIEVKKAGTTSAAAAFNTAVCPANTQITVGFAYKGPAPGQSGILTTGQEFLFKLDLNDGNGPRYQSLFVPTANLPTTILGVAWGLQNGSAVARTMKTDYVFAAKDRFYQ